MKQMIKKNSKKAKIDFGKEISGKLKLIEIEGKNKNDNNGKRELRELDDELDEFRPAPRVTSVIMPRENISEPTNLERQVSQLAPTIDNKKDDDVKYSPKAGDYSANYDNKYDTKYKEVEPINLNRNEFETMGRIAEPRRLNARPFGEMMDRDRTIQEKYEFNMARESNEVGLPFEQKKRKKLL